MSSRGLSGATKARPQLNVNSNYSTGRTATSSRATGPLGKNALQTLGKPASVVRRMPPPATLPSLKAEHGHESLVVQTGGQGWNKSGDSSNDTKSQAADNSSIPSSGAPDLRPTWAKAGISADSAQVTVTPQAQLPRKPVASTPNNREFPTLAASLAAATKQSTTLGQTNSSESQKTQRQILQEGGRGAYVDQDDQIIPAVPPPPVATGSSYIGATVRSDVNRKLPDRYYYGGSQDARASGGRRYDVRQKLAQLSMDSKDSPSTPTEKTADSSTERQSSVPTVPESPLMEMESEVAASYGNQQHNVPQQVGSNLMQKELNHMRSQDVRQYYQTGQPMPLVQPLNELPETAAWNRAEGLSYDYPGPQYRNEVSSPNAPIQQLPGRGDIGQRGQPMRGAPQRMPTNQQHPSQRSRYEYAEESHPPPLMGQRFGSNASWEDYGNGNQGWDMPIADNRMTGMGRPPSNRPAFRGRANSESESGWYSNQQPIAHPRRNDPNGWNYALGDYDNYHRTGPSSNRSRTTSNSYADDYETSGMYYSVDNDRRYKSRPTGKPSEEQQHYEYEYPEDYDRQKYHDYEAHQKPAYRMLKRNDEKSAEYFGSHDGESELMDKDSIALSQLTRLGRSAKPLTFGSLQSESPEIGSSDTFDSSVDQRKTPQQMPGQQNFNRAPGSGKPQQSVLADTSAQQHSTQKANAPPAENVWKKRMEEQQLKQQDEKVAWQSTKQQRKFDLHFPSMSDKKPDSSEPEPSTPPARTAHNKQQVQRHLSANQRAPTKWDDQPSSWNDDYTADTGFDNDTYEGTRREFYNRQRSQRNQNQQTGRVQKSYENSERRQPPRRKRNEPEDAFSNVGEFHAEDYKIEEVRASAPASNRFDNGFDNKKDDSNRQTGGRQNPSRKALNSDERTRQLKPQRASGSRTAWQRQPPQNKTAGEGNDDGEQAANNETEGQRPQRSSNSRNQRSTQQISNQSRPQQQDKRRNSRPVKGLNAQSGEQASGKSIKSPARSENGADEWETASESSDVHGRKVDTTKKPSRPKTREKTPKETNGTTKSSTPNSESQPKSDSTTQRTQPKNEKPASHTFQNNVESASNQNKNDNNSQQQLQARDSRKYSRNHRLSKDYQSGNDHKTVRNGLAGIDMNNISGVVVIDQLPSTGQDSLSDNGDFEEVVSKKTKKQRQIQQQQEEERANRERQKMEQRQKQREDKQQRKPVKRTSIGEKQPSETGKSNEETKVVEQSTEPITKPPNSSLSPLSATDSGVAAVSSTSPNQLALDSDQPSLQSHVVVSIPTQHTVWNSPSPQIANPATTLSDEPEFKTTPVAPIARPKQRLDNDAKTKINIQNDLHSKMAVFGSKDPNYSFGYEHSMSACDDQNELQKLNMDKIKDFWSEEAENCISDRIFEPSINSTLKSGVIQDSSKIGQQTSGTERNTPIDRDILHDESVRNKSRSSTNHFGSNSQSPSTGMLFSNHNNPVYPIGNHFNPISTYSTLLSDNIFNGSPFGPTHASSPPVQAPPSQPFVGGRSLGSFVNPAKVFVANNGTTTTSNDWPTNNADLLNTINSAAPLQLPNAFTNVTTPCFTAPPPAKFQPNLPLNPNIPPPPLGMFPPTHDFRFPPPNPRPNFNPENCRNQPPPNFNQVSQPPPPTNSNRSNHQQQRRPSHNGNNGRQHSGSKPAPLFFVNHPWNGPMKPNGQQQTFGLF